MALATSPFTLKKVGLTLIKTDDATGTAVEYRCQLSRAELVPAAGGGGGGNTLETFCGSYTDQAASSSTWTLELSGFQSFQDVQDFSVLSFLEEGEKFDFELIPYDFEGTVSATNPSFTGEVTMVATSIGGTAATYAVFTASLPLTSKPTMVTV